MAATKAFTDALALAQTFSKEQPTGYSFEEILARANARALMKAWAEQLQGDTALGTQFLVSTFVSYACLTYMQRENEGYTWDQLVSNVRGMMDGGSSAEHAVSYVVDTLHNDSLRQIVDSEPSLLNVEADEDHFMTNDSSLGNYIKLTLQTRLLEVLSE